jgi:FMN-dependent dehydrogenase
MASDQRLKYGLANSAKKFKMGLSGRLQKIGQIIRKVTHKHYVIWEIILRDFWGNILRVLLNKDSKDELVCLSEVSQILLIATMMTKRQNVGEQIEAINLLELEMKARELLPQTAYDFYAGGANDEITLRENRLAYERITLLPRMLVDVSERHLARPISRGPAQTGRSCQQTN